MAAYTIPLTATREPLSPLVRTRRDYRMTAGDVLRLELTIYELDGDAEPLDASDATARLTFWSGPDRWPALVVDATKAGGKLLFDLVAAATAELLGRHEWQIQVAFEDGTNTVLSGIANIARRIGAVLPVEPPPPPVITISIDSITVQVPFIPDLAPGLGAPGNASFGALAVGLGRELVVTLINTGNQPLVINDVGTTGDFLFTGIAS